MMKNNKGITMIALIITVIILLVLATIGIRSSSPVLEEAKLEDVRTDLLLIQAKWKAERERAKFDGTSMFPADQIVQQEKIDDGTYSAEVKWQLIDEYKLPEIKPEWNLSDTVNYYKLTQERLNDMGLGNIAAENEYIVNYQDNDVIYGKGIKYTNNNEEKTYYKLSEMNELFE